MDSDRPPQYEPMNVGEDGLRRIECHDCGAMLVCDGHINETYSHRCKPATAKMVREIIREELARALNAQQQPGEQK